MSAIRIGIGAGLLLLILGFASWGWVATPVDAQVPVHFNLAGEADRYGGKVEAFGLLPLIAIGLSLVFWVAPYIDPRGRNLAHSHGVLPTVWLGTLGVLLAAQAALTLIAVELISAASSLAPRLVLIAVCVLLILLGNVLGKARPNWFVGVRTPWTLSSDRAWDATHRWAGRGFVLTGLVGGLALTLVPLPIAMTVFLGLVALTAIGSVALSYWVWRTDPERETFSEDGKA